MKHKMSKPFITLILIASMIPILLVGYDITRHGQPVPYWDEWGVSLDKAVKTSMGTITFSDLTQQYNDGRPFFTNLLTVISTYVTGWNLKAEMYFNMGLAFITLLLYISLYHHHYPTKVVFIILPFSALVFSLVQRGRWLLAISSVYFFLILFFVLSLWFLNKYTVGWKAIGLAAFFTLCTTYSYANGFLGWFIIVPVLWMLGYHRWTYYLFWGSAAIITLAIYFSNFQFLDLGKSTFNPLILIKFILIYLGNPFAIRPHIWPSLLIGSVGIITFLFNIDYLRLTRQPWSKSAVWLGLAAFVMGSATLAGIGRWSTFGLQGALTSRYTTLASVFWIPFVAIMVTTLHMSYQNKTISTHAQLLLGLNLAVALILTAVFIYANILIMKSPPRITETHRICLQAVPTTGDVTCLYQAVPFHDPNNLVKFRSEILARIDQLDRHHLSVFADE